MPPDSTMSPDATTPPSQTDQGNPAFGEPPSDQPSDTQSEAPRNPSG
jgi:hypothetical protein